MTFRFPWETPPSERSLEDTVTAMQRDMAYMVSHTAVRVRSEHVDLQITVNTPRGQLMPRGECMLSDGSTVEFQDIGMPQPNLNTQELSIRELVACVWEVARELGLELQL